MRKNDLIGAFVIGVLCGLILVLISDFLEVPIELKKFLNFGPIVLPILSVFGISFLSLFREKSLTIFQAGKTFLVGILNTFIDMSILTVLMESFNIFSGSFYVLFKGVSFTTATINSYFWNKFWTFEKKETKDAFKETAQFYLITIGGLLIHLGVSSLIVNFIGPQFGISKEVWAYVGAMAAVFCGFLWNFSGYKFIVFKK